jgi:tetratricopeptide (TPR) repeat protein
MTGKEFKERKAYIETLRKTSELDQARELTVFLIEDLFRARKFTRIVELFYSTICEPQKSFYSFEIAYALSETGYLDEAEAIYEYLLQQDPENSAILNNLSHIKATKNHLHEAFSLVQKAHEIAPYDDVIAENYQNLLSLIQKQQIVQQRFRHALAYLQNENTHGTEKLKTFLANLQQENDCTANEVPIPEWKFGVLMETEQQEAESLVEEWIQKGYLRPTGERDAHLAPIYEVNPFLRQELPRIHKQLPPKWIEGMKKLTIDHLENYSYFPTLHKIRNIQGKYREIVERDFDELFLNYLMNNEKAVILLAGSLVEAVLMHYCEEQHITHFYQKRKNNKTVKRDLYDSDLAEILIHLQEQKMLNDLFVHIGNIARIYRNFIHPGRELKEPELLNESKLELCFLGTLEIINALLS